MPYKTIQRRSIWWAFKTLISTFALLQESFDGVTSTWNSMFPLLVPWSEYPTINCIPDTSHWYLSLLKPTRIVGCKAVILINISKPETYPLRYLQHVASRCVNYAVVSGHGTQQSPTQEVISVPRLTIQKRTVSTHSVTHEVCLWWERQLGFRFSADTWWSCLKILSSGVPVMGWD